MMAQSKLSRLDLADTNQSKTHFVTGLRLMLNKDDTLEKSGVTTAGDYTLCYDYEPVSYPLLTTSV